MKSSRVMACLGLTVALFAVVGCNDRAKDSSEEIEKPSVQVVEPTNSQASVENTPVPVGDTPENSLDWHGTYQGTLPCADCEGIKVELELNSDKTFELKETYLAKEQQESEIEGSFVFDKDQQSIVILSSPQLPEPRKFFIGEGFAEARAMDGSEITGELKAHYRLIKETDVD